MSVFFFGSPIHSSYSNINQRRKSVFFLAEEVTLQKYSAKYLAREKCSGGAVEDL